MWVKSGPKWFLWCLLLLLLLLLEDKSVVKKFVPIRIAVIGLTWKKRNWTEKFEFKRVTANGETHKPWAQHYCAFRSTMVLFNGAQVCCYERIKGNQYQCNNRANSNARYYKQLEIVEFTLPLESELNQLYQFLWFRPLFNSANAEYSHSHTAFSMHWRVEKRNKGHYEVVCG